MTETKYYKVRSQKEFDWLLKHFNLANDSSIVFSDFDDDDLIEYPDNRNDDHWNFSDEETHSNFIEVSDLIEREENKIVFTSEEKEEFDQLKSAHYFLLNSLDDISDSRNGYSRLRKRIYKDNSLNEAESKEFEFARVWANPDLIEVKEEPKFAYKLKPKFKKMLNVENEYLSLKGIRVHSAEYHTAKEWQQVDNELKQIYDRVPENE